MCENHQHIPVQERHRAADAEVSPRWIGEGVERRAVSYEVGHRAARAVAQLERPEARTLPDALKTELARLADQEDELRLSGSFEPIAWQWQVMQAVSALFGRFGDRRKLPDSRPDALEMARILKQMKNAVRYAFPGNDVVAYMRLKKPDCLK